MKRTILIFLSIILLTGCATIFTGTKDLVSFDSDPKGAKVYIDGYRSEPHLVQ